MLNKLIDGQIKDAENFSGGSMVDNNQIYSDRTNLIWQHLLDHMYNTFSTKNYPEDHFGIREKDFPIDEESFVKFINNKIDLDANSSSDFLEKFFKTRGYNNEENRQYHWNESIQKLIDNYRKIFIEKEKINDFSIENLTNASAAASFDNDNFVRPAANSSNSTYLDVRNKDELISVLKDSKNLQFTINQDERYNTFLNLLMPQYNRNLEIEDLDRNFWVIGQSIAALSAFLLDEESPLIGFIDGMLDEITQLWENIFYLWLCNCILGYKKLYDNIETIFMPVPESEIYPYLNFDDFADNTRYEDTLSFDNYGVEERREVLKKLWENHYLDLKQRYRDSALVIIPEIRGINYKDNHYSRVSYLGVIFYDDSLPNPDDFLRIVVFKGPIIVDAKEGLVKAEIYPNLRAKKSDGSGDYEFVRSKQTEDYLCVPDWDEEEESSG